MATPAVFSVPTTGIQPPFAFPPFGAVGPLWWTVLLTQLPADTTTTPKPTAPPAISVVVVPYPQPVPPGPQPSPVPPPGPPLCNVNCPPVWEPLCSVNGLGYMYNFASVCALQAQNCVSGSDFRYLYPGICRLKRSAIHT